MLSSHELAVEDLHEEMKELKKKDVRMIHTVGEL
jgi:hypothetical protein